MECCVGVYTETVLQAVKFYTIVKKNFKKKTDVSDYNPSSEWIDSLRQMTTVRNVSLLKNRIVRVCSICDILYTLQLAYLLLQILVYLLNAKLQSFHLVMYCRDLVDP